MIFVFGILGLPLIKWVLMRVFEGMVSTAQFFPSERVMVPILFYGFLVALLGYVLKRNGYPQLTFIFGVGLCFLLIVLSCSSLLLNGESLSDQLTGDLLGLSWLALILAILQAFKKKGFH